MVVIVKYCPSYEELGLAINDILLLIKPTQEDHERRQTIIKEFTTIIRSLGGFTDAKVEPFGSFLYNLYTRKADLDISVDILSSFTTDANILEYIWRALQKRNLPSLNFVPLARIPVLTFETKIWNINCDITINNHLGQIKSKFLLWISKIDKRFCDMVLLVKEWARSHDINDPKEGTFNSYALCLLVIFHLQTCVPAILPPLKDIYTGSVDVNSSMKTIEERRIQRICATNIEEFITLRTVNRSTLAELMDSFFEKFSELEDKAAEHVISTYSGKWENRCSYRRMGHKTKKLIVEDPLDLSDNAARTVWKSQLSRISQVFHITNHQLCYADQDRRNYIACLLGKKVEFT